MDYKTVCDKCYRKTYYTTSQPCHYAPCGGTLRVIDESDLDARFTPYYASGERVEVTYADGETERFYVGKSTGWKPIYLAIKTSRSHGGGAVPRTFVSLRSVGRKHPRFAHR